VLQKAFEGEIDVNDILVTYNVVPVSSRAGFIEWVPNCRDVYSMNNTERKNIQSWIFSQPVNKLTPVDEVRNRFIHSSAAYTVISYLLGVGDRHKHNFMATTEGKFFHIDYGYVLGLHPNPILMAPHLRFTTQMVDFIGGPGTDEWKKFLDLTVRIFHCLRRRYSVVMRLLMLLVDADPPICDKLYTLDRVRTAIFGRFAPDQSDKAAEEAFRRRMETDTDRVDETLGDKMHRWSIDRVVSQAVRTAALSLSDVAYGTFSEIGTAVYTVGSIAHQYATRVTPDPPNDTSSPAP
jgi:phosphatidylinositol 3-kinase